VPLDPAKPSVPSDSFDPAAILEQITSATEQLLQTAARLTDTDVRAPSLLPDWSRGHVLTHLARNADGGTRLLTWARTGVPAAEYPSMAARAEEIEAGSGRTAEELLTDVRESAERFAAQYRQLPPEAWQRTVRWTGGQEHPAARAADSRLTEVLIHHVDLDAGYTPAQWPTDFVRFMLRLAVSALSKRDGVPAMRLTASDTGTSYELGSTAAFTRDTPVIAIHGAQHSLSAWLTGRSPGADLIVQDDEPLPKPPPLY
jgi:maleylpyruvate isomerase